MHTGCPSSGISFQGESCSIPVCHKDGISKTLCSVVAEEQRRVQQDLRSETLSSPPPAQGEMAKFSSPPLNQPSWGRGLSRPPRSPPPPSFLSQGLRLEARD